MFLRRLLPTETAAASRDNNNNNNSIRNNSSSSNLRPMDNRSSKCRREVNPTWARRRRLRYKRDFIAITACMREERNRTWTLSYIDNILNSLNNNNNNDIINRNKRHRYWQACTMDRRPNKPSWDVLRPVSP